MGMTLLLLIRVAVGLKLRRIVRSAFSGLVSLLILGIDAVCGIVFIRRGIGLQLTRDRLGLTVS